MATGTDAGGTWNTTAGNKTVVATPALDDLIVVVHGISGWASGDDSTITDNNSDGNGTYTKYGTASAPLSDGGGTACALWFSVRNSLIGSASSTTFTATNSGDTGGGLTVLRFSGMTRTGASAVKQTKGESTATENPPTLTFNATTLTSNPVVLACMGEDNPLALTPPTGFTEADDTGWATPTTGVEVCWDDSGNAATLFSWSGGAATDHNEIGVELDASNQTNKSVSYSHVGTLSAPVRSVGKPRSYSHVGTMTRQRAVTLGAKAYSHIGTSTVRKAVSLGAKAYSHVATLVTSKGLLFQVSKSFSHVGTLVQNRTVQFAKALAYSAVHTLVTLTNFIPGAPVGILRRIRSFGFGVGLNK